MNPGDFGNAALPLPLRDDPSRQQRRVGVWRGRAGELHQRAAGRRRVPTTASWPGRYDIGLASLGDRIFFGGGTDANGNVLGDLYECEVSTGTLTSYGNALPLGGAPYLGIDEHGEGLIYAGGYYGTTWYRDLWRITLTPSGGYATFLYDFAPSGLGPSEHYAVVPDVFHQMYWAIPGHATTATPNGGVWFLDGASVSVNDGDGGGLMALRTGGSAVNPARQTVSGRDANRAQRVRANTPRSDLR